MQTDSMDLSAASAGALTDLEVPATPADSSAAAPDAAAQPQAPSPTDPSTGPADSSDLLELKVKDKVERISLSKERDKLVELAQKGLDYTQKTQLAADERRQIEQYAQALAAREQQLVEFLRDPVRVTQYAQQLLAQQSPQAAQDPNAVATVAEVQQTLQQELARVRAESQQHVAAALFQADVARYQGEYQADLLKTVRDATEKFPILDSVADNPEELLELLKGDLARKGLQPTSIDEARKIFGDLAKARADRLHAKVVDHSKMEAVRAAKLVKSGPEPPGGGAPAPKPSNFKLGDPRLTAAAIDDMEASGRH